MRNLHLLHFKGCPNVEQARENLREALGGLGLSKSWQEIDLESSECPAQLKGFPSPTVLVDGVDVVSGAAAQAGTSSCRAAGAPTAAQIAAALKRGPGLSSLAALPAAAAGLVPATFCPACYPALAGLLGAIGLGAYTERLLAPFTLVLLVVALAGLAYQARRSRDFRPLAIGALGASAMYAGQFLLACSSIKLFGIGLLIVASFWNARPRLTRRGAGCRTCAEGG